MMKLSLAIVIILLGSLVTAQNDCPLPNNADIITALNTLLLNSDGSQTYNPEIIGSVHYVCLSQGSRENTYRSASIIATFTPSTGQAQETRIFQLSCESGPAWSADTSGGLATPDSSVVNGTTRYCRLCNHNFGNDRCQACAGSCTSAGGLMRCIGGTSTCCTVFAPNSDCSTDLNCTSFGVNYEATASNGYMCSCVNGFTGNDCNTNINDCDLDPCQNGGNCTDEIADYACTCVSGYSGKNCSIDIDACDPNPCQNEGTCTHLSAPNNYICNCTSSDYYTGVNCTECSLPCPDGYTSNDDCTTCVLSNICLAHNPCTNGGSCTLGSSPTDYACDCVNNYSGNNCTICSLNCQSGNVTNDCSTCTCSVGYTGNLCDTPINYCVDNPCGVYGTCTSHLTGYTCTCRNGWRGDHCQDCDIEFCTRCTGTPPTCQQCSDRYVITGSKCELGDLCHLHPCRNNGTCLGRPGSFTCQCPELWNGNANCSQCTDGYGLRGNQCASCSKNCLLCAESVNDCTSCEADYEISKGQCVSTRIPNSLLIWIIIGSVIGGVIVLAAVCFIVMAFVRCSSNYNERMSHKRANRDPYKAGNKVSNNPLYLSKDDLMKEKEEEDYAY